MATMKQEGIKTLQELWENNNTEMNKKHGDNRRGTFPIDIFRFCTRAKIRTCKHLPNDRKKSPSNAGMESHIPSFLFRLG